MKLSTLYTTVPDYIEFAWVTTPDAASQSLPANSQTKLTINTEVSDEGGHVSAPSSNNFTLPAGTYYFEAHSWVLSDNYTNGRNNTILSLKTSGGTYLGRSNTMTAQAYNVERMELSGQFVLTGSTTMALYALSNRDGDVGGLTTVPASTVSTAGEDQRHTIKFWKLK